MTHNSPGAPGGVDQKERGRAGGRQRTTLAALLGSVLVHVVVLVIALPPHFDSPPEPPPEEKPFAVTTSVEEAPPDKLLAEVMPPEENPEFVEEKREKEEEPDVVEETPEEDEKVEEPEEVEEKEFIPQPKPPEKNFKIVQQETNEEMPEKADYLSQQANRIEEETRAQETTTMDVLPGKTVPDDLKEETGGDEETRAENEKELASAAHVESSAPEEQAPKARPNAPDTVPPTPTRPPEQAATPEVPEPDSAEAAAAQDDEGINRAADKPEANPFLKKPSPKAQRAHKPAPRSLFEPNARDYERVFGESDKKAATRVDRHKKGRRLLKGWKDRERAMRASLENTINEVRPGNHTGVNAAPSVYADFIGRIHRKLHPLWGSGYLPRLDSDYPLGHPLSNPNLEVTLEYIIDAATGKVDAVNIAKSSGAPMFDGEGVMIFHAIGPHTHAPPEIVSPDGKVYIHWTLWRDQQQCGPWGAHILIVDNGEKKRVDTAGRTASGG